MGTSDSECVVAAGCARRGRLLVRCHRSWTRCLVTSERSATDGSTTTARCSPTTTRHWTAHAGCKDCERATSQRWLLSNVVTSPARLPSGACRRFRPPRELLGQDGAGRKAGSRQGSGQGAGARRVRGALLGRLWCGLRTPARRCLLEGQGSSAGALRDCRSHRQLRRESCSRSPTMTRRY